MPLVEELVPAPDPWDVARKLVHLPHLLFLDSAGPHAELGRYSYVAAAPRKWLQFPAAGLTDPFAALAEFIPDKRTDSIPGLPPFQGGVAGLFGYGLSHYLERIPRPGVDEFQVPDLAVGIYDWVYSFDRAAGRAWLVRASEAASASRVLSNPGHGRFTQPRSPNFSLPGFPGVTSNFDRPGYEAAVRRVVEYVHAGDVSRSTSRSGCSPRQRFAARTLRPAARAQSGAVRRLFRPRRFRDRQRFAGAVLALSPTGEVETRPIKGTRPRGRTPAEDDANRRALLASPKDRAENVMIVDLLRNDLGRVCEYGSVRVSELCRLESYRRASSGLGGARHGCGPGMRPIDLLRAAFPGGSVTGAPKVRAMEIIAELEPTARGPYCGSLGYIGFDGSMDTNILIRTFTLGQGWVQFPVGGGIVADSDPAAEYEETLHKAAGLLRALE